MKKSLVYMCLHTALNYSTTGNKTRFLIRPFLISTSRFLILIEAFRNNHVAACRTALRSATEKNKMGGHLTVPCSSKKTQCSGTVDCPKS